MKVFFALSVWLLVGTVDASHSVSVSAEVCEQELCECNPPRAVTAENLKYNAERECFCACGGEVDGECLVDQDCVHGLHCAAGDSLTGKGKCKDACKKPGLGCDIFDYCQIKSDGEPECKCNIRACSDILIGSGVCTIDPQENNAKQTFNNDCLFVNEQCKRRQEGKNKLERRPILTCAVEIEPNLGGGGLHGWRMSGI
ncbi:uncharacterized protein LOC117299688 [Asterias rubens]|uniref:uncharacterized protein LOC117299688 n=1 Tax=Asterias rubens TaxID=7604 RepID=UPI001455D319|nr:uncharacterized protein LOC117299688 [Asterias rubens]